jgi:hypothetical protein
MSRGPPSKDPQPGSLFRPPRFPKLSGPFGILCRMRTNVYVDGFNLYYGSLKGTQYRWLDLEAMCTQLLPPPRHDVQRIRVLHGESERSPWKAA